MEILVLNENQVQTFKTNKRHAVISFQEPGIAFVSLPELPSRIDYIGIHCYDLDEDTGIFPYSRFVFTVNHARTILTSLELWKNMNIELIIINCVAGLSRSVGCAAAISKILKGNDDKYFKNGLPNMLIYSTLLKEYYK